MVVGWRPTCRWPLFVVVDDMCPCVVRGLLSLVGVVSPGKIEAFVMWSYQRTPTNLTCIERIHRLPAHVEGRDFAVVSVFVGT